MRLSLLEPNWLARRRAQIHDYACQMQELRERVRLQSHFTLALRFGVPALSLVMLALTLLIAALFPDEDNALSLLGVLLLIVAGLPWLGWLVLGDNGPTWPSLLAIIGPVGALVTGQWFVPRIGLGSEAAFPLLAFPLLFVIVLTVAVAPRQLAWGACVMSYLAFTGPLIAAAATERGVTVNTVVTWQVVFLLASVVGYAVRMSFEASAAAGRAMDAQAQQAIEEERRRIGRDVHDVVAHTLAVTMLHVTGARMALRRNDTAGATEALQVAEHHGRESMGEIRRMVHLLRADTDSALDQPQPGLDEIAAMVERYRAAGLAVDYTATGPLRHTSPTAELAVYRVVQEALTNATRHGSGTATVSLAASPAGLSLRVANPVTKRATGPHRGSGVIGMTERIAAAGGMLVAGLREREQEWVVTAEVPA